jgi:serine/threonine protein kinase
MPVQFAPQTEPIPGYKLLAPLGKGGFGEVWKAEAPGGLLKAIKLVHGSLRSGHGEEVLVQQELKALTCVRGVRHPYILSMDRFDIIDGQLIIVMELADKCLSDRFNECVGQGMSGIPRDELLRYLDETAEALDLMNIQYKLQHSDIKPQNLFLVHHHIKVADFGLVKDLQGMKAMNNGGFSPLYAAPETFEGWVSAHSDQYSLAIVYQELLTGVRPFDGKNARQLLMQHMQAPPNLAPLPASDREVIGRALAKKPDERFPSCTDLVLALCRSSLASPPPATKAPAVPAEKPAAAAPSTLQGTPPGGASGFYQLTFPAKCSGCGYMGRVPKTFKGRPVKCRECGAVFTANPVADTPLPASMPSPTPAATDTPAPQKASLPMPPSPKPGAPPAPKPPPVSPPAQKAAAPPARPTGRTPVPKPAAPATPSKSASVQKPTAAPPRPTPVPPKPPVAAPKQSPAPGAPAPKPAWVAPPTAKVETPPAPTAPSNPPPTPPAAKAESSPAPEKRPAPAPPRAATAPPPVAPPPARPKETHRMVIPAAQPVIAPPAAPPPKAETPAPASAPPPTSSPPPPKPAPAPAEAESAPAAVPDVECPVCGHNKHERAPNQSGAIKCLQCGCVHTTKPGEGPSPKPASVPLPPQAVLSVQIFEPKPVDVAVDDPAANVIECPVCGAKGQVPDLFVGGTLKCHQCGCVHRV